MTRRMNPEHGSKRSRASEEAAASSSAQPQKQPMRRTISKKKGPKEPQEFPQEEIATLRKKNPYCLRQDDALVGHPFWNKTQSLIYSKIIKTRTNLFVDVKSIDMGHVTSNPHTAYFTEAYALCEKWGLGPIIGFNKDFDSEIVAQFYDIVHFHEGDERLLTWMTGARVLHSDWKTFMNCVGIAERGMDEHIGLRPHTEGIPTIHKSKLIRY
ncbi:hypothetical protein D1007_18214 [Hordeum vulgare]|nr:hypothetical protein D1007_18214 [Hordeum vulgare]